MAVIQNPVLKGFHPDPSIIRVDEDYYIATSTFEWWPGVKISHSKDLVHWETLTYALQSTDLLDLRGVGASQGIWAPCLTYSDGVFYLVYTVVNSFYCNMYDTRNFLVTAKDIMGPWSMPVPLNNFGFDPSMFHDEDGKKYVVSMVTDHRIPKKYAGRIVLQEYDAEKECMTGPVREIYQGEKIFLEGPHILKKDGWYYLFSADTGTGEAHGQTIQRSRSVWGPYEMYKEGSAGKAHVEEWEAYSILTSRHHQEWPLQKSGHADLVETQNGDWYAVHLCGRPLANRNPENAARFPGHRRYPLGRETAIQKMRWTEDGWLEMEQDGVLPGLEVPAPELPECAFDAPPVRDEFDNETLGLEYQSLRIPMTEEYVSLKARPGWLRMYGREGLASLFRQTLIARRWTEFCFSASACMEFEPEVFKQMAGLICFYDTENYLYLHVSRDEDLGKCISILKAENKKYSYPVGFAAIPDNCQIFLKVDVNRDRLRFSYSLGDEEHYQYIGEDFDCSFLSDEACDQGWFTGAMVGICCQDLTGCGKYADFDFFEYRTGTLGDDAAEGRAL